MRTAPWLAALLLWLSPAAAAADPSATGELLGVIFDGDNAPLAGVAVEISTERHTTNADGTFRVLLPPGAHALKVRAGAEVIEVAIVIFSGEQTQLIVTLGDPPNVEIETPARGRAPDPAEASPEDGPTGRVSGRAVNVEDDQPIEGARVVVRGASAEALTDPDGRFTLLLPVGEVDLTVIHPSFSALVVSGVLVQEGGEAEVPLRLTPTGGALTDLTVTAPRIEGGALELLDERRSTAAVSDIIGAEQISRSGDSDAAGALRRVTGVTLVGGRYVYVRGLGDRYSSTLLNGAALPSPEPERRVVPLDLFPASILASILIQKTWTPEMPGEFAGGVVVLRTRGFPGERSGKLSLDLGLREGTTFSPSLREPGGTWDWLGVDGGTRALPEPIKAASSQEKLLEGDRFGTRGYSAEELEAFGESMRNVWTPETHTPPPALGLSVELGDSGTLFGMPSGYLASLSYDNAWARKDRTVRIHILSGGELEEAHRYEFEELVNTISLSGLVSTGLDLSPRHRLRWTIFTNRITDNEARRFEGPNRDVGSTIQITRLSWLERSLISQQLRGEHDLGGDGQGGELKWRYSLSLALRDEPDRREVRYDLEENTGEFLLSDRPEGNQRVFSALVDLTHDLGADLTLPFALFDPSDTLQLGLSAVFRDREVDTRRFKVQHKGALSGDTDILDKRPEDIFTPQNIGPQGFQFEEITRQTDNYQADQTLLALYLMGTWRLLPTLSLVTGARLERSAQTVETFELFNPDAAPVNAELTTLDLLPAAVTTWDLADDMKLRLGASQTLSRPDFRELSPATFNDVTGGRQVFGNPDLKRARIWNADLRWEWYPAEGESLSIGVFAKRFEDPIESIVVVSAQHSVTYANARDADNLGIEIEAQRSLEILDPALRDLYVAFNATAVYSRVTLDDNAGIQTSDERPLQGQAPWVLNLQLGYDNPDDGSRAAILANVTGPRIEEVGALGAPDVLKQPAPTLDLILSQSFGQGWKLSFKAKNLLDPPIRLTQGDKVTEVAREGRDASLSLSYGW